MIFTLSQPGLVAVGSPILLQGARYGGIDHKLEGVLTVLGPDLTGQGHKLCHFPITYAGKTLTAAQGFWGAWHIQHYPT
jgi:hypothetical protein